MGKIHIGPKHLINSMKTGNSFAPISTPAAIEVQDNSLTLMQNRVNELEYILNTTKPTIPSIDIQYIHTQSPPVTVYVDKIVEKEVVKYVDVPGPTKETIVYQDRFVPTYINRNVEIPKIMFTKVKFIPKWIYGVIGIESLVIVLLLIFK